MKKVKTSVMYILLSLWALVNLFPLYWMFTFSLKTNKEIFGDNIIGLPKEWLWSNYSEALDTGNMALYFANSAIVTFVTIALTVIFSLMATYALLCTFPHGMARPQTCQQHFYARLNGTDSRGNPANFYHLTRIKDDKLLSGTHNSLHRICIGDGDYDLSKFH